MRYPPAAVLAVFTAVFIVLALGSQGVLAFDAGLTNFAVSQGKRAIERCRRVKDVAEQLECVAKGLDQTANNVGRPDYAPAVRTIRKAAKNVRAAAKTARSAKTRKAKARAKRSAARAVDVARKALLRSKGELKWHAGKLAEVTVSAKAVLRS